MVTQNRIDVERENLRYVLPIPHGTFMLVFFSVLCVGLPSVCMYAAHKNGLRQYGSWSDTLFDYALLGMLAFLLYGFFTWYIPGLFAASSGGVKKWLGKWWDNNVLGFNVWFWIRGDDHLVDPDVGILISSKFDISSGLLEQLCSIPNNSHIFLCIPSGGWLRHKRGPFFHRIRPNEDGDRLLWRVRVRAPIVDPLIGSSIEVSDSNGDRVTLTVSEALRFASSSGYGVRQWECRVPDLMRDVRDWYAKFAKASEKAKLDQAILTAEARDRRRRLIEETIARLDATKRFIKSKQAQEIREWLVSQLPNQEQIPRPTDPPTAPSESA